jgi:spore coat protein JB
MSDKERLLKTIQAYDFSLYELNLYLDTHPNCQHGLAYFRKYLALKSKALEEYNRRFGSITAEQLEPNATTWEWSTTPFPWERGCD